jgi:hypothetical protein
MPVRCLNEKGEVRFIPDRLAAMPDYMRRHKLTLDTLEPLEQLKPLKEVVLEVEVEVPQEEVIATESLESTLELTKEEYWAMLDEKGVEYKKTYGIAKLKELNDAN